jgi:hypothetical protein
MKLFKSNYITQTLSRTQGLLNCNGFEEEAEALN